LEIEVELRRNKNGVLLKLLLFDGIKSADGRTSIVSTSWGYL
ncbi:hypothetical protein F442_18574, partial [Phytophthora nicotianae P10297]